MNPLCEYDSGADMGNGILWDICTACLKVGQITCRVYGFFQASAQDDALQTFWGKMLEGEKQLVVFWESLLPLIQAGMIPDIFDDPERIQQELTRHHERAMGFSSNLATEMAPKDMFILAFRLEYYLLYPVFEILFDFARELRLVSASGGNWGDPKSHVSDLFEGVTRFCGASPEMELLGETMKMLWMENRRLATTINTDPLTGLMNKRGFFNASKPLMDLALRDRKNIGLILADLDDFKKFNALYGQQAGDKLLKSIGSALRQVVRSSDLVTRFGGEEFMILFYAIEHCHLDDMAAKIAKTIQACSSDGQGCTASVGAATLMSGKAEVGTCCVNLEEVLSVAAKNLEKAKETGEGGVVVS